jgi:2,4-dienoyl-CoA reductase-like NADH-dependent reductase (Old Yellow Enzyme family)
MGVRGREEEAVDQDMSGIDSLLTPIAIRGARLTNRIVMAPMSRYRSTDGIPGDDVASYYARRAATGIGLIVTEGVGVAHAVAVDHPGVPHMHGDDALAGWGKVVEAVHGAGGVIWPQLWHQGVMWNVEHGGGSGGAAMRPSGLWGPEDGMISIPPSARATAIAETQAMTDSDIQDVIDAYAVSARHARALGFDGIAIHGAHGYLIDTFLWGFTNRRADRWGGDPKGRAAFGSAVVRAIRREVGEEMPIALRFSQFKMQDYKALLAATPDELGQLLQPLADAGVDVFDGSQRFFDTPLFNGSPLNLAGWAKALTGKLAMTVGGIGLDKSSGPARHIDDSQKSTNNLPRVVERFARGEFDLVGVGRSILNDPGWFTKARAGEPFLPFDPANLERLT